MTNLATQLSKACSALGLRAELGFNLSLGEGIEVHAVARIPDLGAPKGMLVVNSFDEVKNFSQTLINAGYGYSVLSEPSQNEEFHLDSFREMFIDWGWSGDTGCKPQWMKQINLP